MSIATEITRLQTAKANLKASIEAKGVTVSSSATLDAYPALVDNIPSGGGTTGDVVFFYDYDGTLVKSYTGVEIQALSALPNAPDHSQDEVPLTFDEWNWSLAQIKAYNTSYPNAIINVGANYHTTDGKNHFYFNITSDTDGNGVEIVLQGRSQGDTVDWGDGSAIQTISSNTLTHIYTSIGEYHCIINSTSTYYNIGGSSSTRRNRREKLTKACLSNNVTSIGDNAFQNCYSLQSITIPSSVTSIGNSAFNACYSLKLINIPSDVTSIASSAFYNCYSLQSVIIPSDVTSIASFAFYYCYSLQSITIPNTVTSIGDSAFSGCSSLQSITTPNTVTSIGSFAFSGCYSLQSINIPSGITSIGTYAFQNCYSLQSITIPSSVTSIGNYAFQNCSSLQSITIPSGVTSIGNYAFQGCRSLQSITIPNTVTSIGTYAFSGCSSLQSITISSSVTSIGSYTFDSCYSLQSITIPSSVTSIGSGAFVSCYSLYSVTILPITPPTLSANVFDTTSQKKIYVPYSADHSILAAYQSETNWSNYASIMEELPE